MSELLINSLEVTGYRTFRHLEIPELGRVNLIVGKNNVGKTAFLEALRVYADRGRYKTIYSILHARDEVSEVVKRPYYPYEEKKFVDIKNLFYGRGELLPNPPHFTVRVNSDASKTLSFYIRLHEFTSSGGLTPVALDSNPTQIQRAMQLAEVELGSLKVVRFNILGLTDATGLEVGSVDVIPHQFVPAIGFTRKMVSDLWDQLALTDNEHVVLESLKLLLPDVERLNFLAKEEDEKGRTPYIKVKGKADPIQIRNMGEGMYRLLGLSMALASAQNGFLLVDEVETGFHYSILPKVWKLIFETAARLNVQVFATTHSWDCIEAFQRANSFQNESEGILIRLEAKPDKTKVTSFDKESLAIVTREQIEVR